ncbi:hypothetical protein QBC45DRAFT_303767, partial [Copromyces sp. CBS 386.78]
MSSPGPDSQPEEIDVSQPSNTSSSIPDVPSSTSNAPNTPATPSLSMNVPGAFDLSSVPATLSLSGSLINGHSYPSRYGYDNDKMVIYSGNAAECPRRFIIYVDLTGDMHGDKIEILGKQEEDKDVGEKERKERKKQQEDKDLENLRTGRPRQRVPYWVAYGDSPSNSDRHLQYLRVDATRSVFPWQPSTTPSSLDQPPPGSPAELPVEASVEAPVESKPGGSPGDLLDSEAMDSPQ